MRKSADSRIYSVLNPENDRIDNVVMVVDYFTALDYGRALHFPDYYLRGSICLLCP